MSESSVMQIHVKKTFSFEEAQDLARILYKISSDANEVLRKQIAILENAQALSEEQKAFVEKKIDDIISKWQDKVESLGAQPKGIWLVDIDNGQEFYCWKYPERIINHTHGYSDGFSSRKSIKSLA